MAEEKRLASFELDAIVAALLASNAGLTDADAMVNRYRTILSHLRTGGGAYVDAANRNGVKR